MQTLDHNSEINLVELKARLVKKLGSERYKQYFFYLNKFLSLRLSKIEFNKVCLRILGRDNVSLHNQLIRSILKHACSGKTIQKDDVFDHRKKHVSANGYYQPQGNVAMTSGSAGLSNAVHRFPPSPRTDQNRSNEQRARSVLGSNGKISSAPETHLNPSDVSQPNNHVVTQAETIRSHASEMPVMRRHVSNQPEFLVKDDRKEGFARNLSGDPLLNPLLHFRRQQRALHLANCNRCFGTQRDGVLSDCLTLKERMDEIAVANGIDGVSMDSVNVLNHGLDSFLRGVLNSCTELSKNTLWNNQNYMMQNISELSEMRDQRAQHVISFRELRVAMEMNPQNLGGDWPLLLEKICLHSFED